MSEKITAFMVSYRALKKQLSEDLMVSELSFLEENLKKNFLVSCASYHEKFIKELIEKFSASKCNDNAELMCFIRKKAIDRQYHTYFDWDCNNCNLLFSLFGNAFRDQMKKNILDDVSLEASVNDFITIGCQRNKMVHNNFSESTSSFTIEEINDKHNSAMRFLENLESTLLK